jgi:acyl-CoA oxidase
MTPFDAFVDVQDHCVDLARAHAERLLLDGMIDWTDTVDDADLQDVLPPLRSLFALSRIEADLDWFLEAGYVEGAKSKAIRNEVNELCDALRPAAEGLVDAFGIPDALLRAPIGTDSANGRR